MEKRILDFYLTQGDRTMVNKDFAAQFPDDIPTIVKYVQNILIHKGRVGRESSLPHNTEDPALELKDNMQIVERAQGNDISQTISLEKKVVCICRNYTMLLAAVLRTKGFPARSRCGFGIYFGGGNYEDHWICEYWSEEKNKWVQVDAQMDEYWRNLLYLNHPWFNHLDLPRGEFLYGSHVWELYRQGVVDGDICGFSPEGIFGEDYIRANMMRDFFALNNIEYLYNEKLPLMGDKNNLSEKDLEMLDYIAKITKEPDQNFDEIRDLFTKFSMSLD